MLEMYKATYILQGYSIRKSDLSDRKNKLFYLREMLAYSILKSPTLSFQIDSVNS